MAEENKKIGVSAKEFCEAAKIIADSFPTAQQVADNLAKASEQYRKQRNNLFLN